MFFSFILSVPQQCCYRGLAVRFKVWLWFPLCVCVCFYESYVGRSVLILLRTVDSFQFTWFYFNVLNLFCALRCEL